jgi:hypothetical protein
MKVTDWILRGRRREGSTQIHNSREFYVPDIIFSGKFQVTNQMISACKAHITNNGTATIWSQPQEIVMQKIAAVIKLKQVKVLELRSVLPPPLCLVLCVTFLGPH